MALLKVGALGDVLRTTALLPGLKRLHPELDLTWATSAEAFPILLGNPLIQRVVDFRDPKVRAWTELEYDRVISLDDDADVCRLASSLSCRRLSGSYVDGSGELRYTPDLEEWFGMGKLRRREDGGLARANELKRSNDRDFGEILYRGLNLPGPVERPILMIADRDRKMAIEWLATTRSFGGPLVGLNTGAGGRWRFKSWGLAQTAELARNLAQKRGALVVVLGGAAEKDRNSEIVAQADSPAVVAAPCDLPLLSFAAVLEQLAVLVSSDSLAMHMAIALRRPVVAFFGPTSDAEIGLFGLGEKLTTTLGCRRCYLSDCDVRPHCMDSIQVDAMFQAVSRWLEVSPKVTPSSPN